MIRNSVAGVIVIIILGFTVDYVLLMHCCFESTDSNSRLACIAFGQGYAFICLNTSFEKVGHACNRFD